MSLTVGSKAPAFSTTALVGEKAQQIRLSDYAGRWVVLYFYPKDDTGVCESENIAFRDRLADFEALDAQVLGASVDSLESHKRWRDKSLGPLPYPWIADESKALAEAYEVLHADTGLALRGTFLINPDGIVCSISVHDLAVGRSLKEIIRTLQALQSGKPTRCNWQPGEPTL